MKTPGGGLRGARRTPGAGKGPALRLCRVFPRLFSALALRAPSRAALATWGFLTVLSVLQLQAVYAPIPEQEQGKAFTVTAIGNLVYDSNIFGASTSEIDSYVYSGAVRGAFNASLTDQSFASSFYKLTADTYSDRPGTKTLLSHEFLGRFAHAFSPLTTLDLVDFFQSSRNPESLLAGVPLNTDQSFKRNQFDGRLTTGFTEKAGIDLKFRNTIYRFDNANLGRDLDRTENLYGLAGLYGFLPELKGLFEYRRQTVDYRQEGGLKDKQSDFALAGFDYKAAEKMSLGLRFGAEWRRRTGASSTTAPSAELSLKYDLAPQSYITAGYAHALEEASNVASFTDTQVNRLFANLQYALRPNWVASSSATFEMAGLQPRPGFSKVKDKTVRLGFAVSYIPRVSWLFNVSYDLDKVASDDAGREMTRHRLSLAVHYTF